MVAVLIRDGYGGQSTRDPPWVSQGGSLAFRFEPDVVRLVGCARSEQPGRAQPLLGNRLCARNSLTIRR